MSMEKKSNPIVSIIILIIVLGLLYRLYKWGTAVLDTKSFIFAVVAFLLGLLILFGLTTKVFIGRRRNDPVSQEHKGNQKLDEIINKYPELSSLVAEAKQSGASHFEYSGPGITFYRIREGKWERCFAEYTTGRYVWIWDPSNWNEYQQFPESAIPMPKTTDSV
jgi:hypothetical protein